MDETPIIIREESLHRSTLKKSNIQTKKKTIIIGTLLVLLWSGLIYTGYWYIEKTNESNREYIDSKIESEIEKIQPSFDSIYQNVLTINTELESINQELALTDSLLYGTDENKVLLQQRIDQLTLQLNELQAAIERLNDATSN